MATETAFRDDEQRIAEYLRRDVADPDVRLDRDLDLLATGVLDSIGVLRLATFVAEELEVEIRPSDFVIENFRSIAAVAAYVARARGGDGR